MIPPLETPFLSPSRQHSTRGEVDPSPLTSPLLSPSLPVLSISTLSNGVSLVTSPSSSTTSKFSLEFQKAWHNTLAVLMETNGTVIVLVIVVTVAVVVVVVIVVVVVVFIALVLVVVVALAIALDPVPSPSPLTSPPLIRMFRLQQRPLSTIWYNWGRLTQM